MMNEIIKCTSRDSILRINWHILNWCNYRCSYCAVKPSLTSDFKDLSQVSQNYKTMISRLGTIDKPFEVCLTGGEPTLHPNLNDLLERLTNLNNLKKVWFFTNLSRSVSFISTLKKYPKLSICASYHPEYYTDKFIEKCKILQCEVHISMLEKYKDQIKELLKILIENDIPYKFTLLENTIDFKETYSNEFKEMFKEELSETDNMIDIDLEYRNGTFENTNNFKLVLSNKNKFKGYTCVPESFQINLDNIVRNVCTSEVMGLSLKGISKTVICPKEKCVGGLTMYPKKLK